MNITATIRNFFMRGANPPESPKNPEDIKEQQIKPQGENEIKPVRPESGFEFLDGMSTGTARFIIDREVGKDILKKYDIEGLENKGRYYLAKIINKDGHVTETVLIDKLNRSIHFQKAKFR